MRYRSEKKLTLDAGAFQRCRALLDGTNHLFKRVHEDRIVSSIYFDDTNLSRYFAHTMGQACRKKTRIRFYCRLANIENKDLSCTLEHKIKVYDLGTKLRTKGKFWTLYKHTLPLQAVAAVSYTRKYYEAENGLRVTLDSNLEYALPLIIGNTVKFTSTRKQFINIVEIKTPKVIDEAELNSLHMLLKQLGGRIHKFSKYCDATERLGLVY